MKIQNNQSAFIVLNLIKIIQENKDYLSEVDGATGDGDHGINMNKGFTICLSKIKDAQVDFGTALSVLGKTLLLEIGGSMGPLYGTFFIEMSKACKDKEEIDKYLFGEMFEQAFKGLQVYSKAQLGDKTLFDTLIPAMNAYKESLDKNDDFAACLNAMKAAADRGKESTINMIAKIGRASRLGERSRGNLDAGAVSCCLIINSMADSILSIIN
jgi:phosphoenolpyruvate---glycerone phosphotransferase subunit DhaL